MYGITLAKTLDRKVLHVVCMQEKWGKCLLDKCFKKCRMTVYLKYSMGCRVKDNLQTSPIKECNVYSCLIMCFCCRFGLGAGRKAAELSPGARKALGMANTSQSLPTQGQQAFNIQLPKNRKSVSTVKLVAYTWVLTPPLNLHYLVIRFIDSTKILTNR